MNKRSVSALRGAVGGLVVACSVAGCGREWYRDWADEEVEAVLRAKRSEVLEASVSGREFPRTSDPIALGQVATEGATEDLSRAPPPTVDLDSTTGSPDGSAPGEDSTDAAGEDAAEEGLQGGAPSGGGAGDTARADPSGRELGGLEDPGEEQESSRGPAAEGGDNLEDPLAASAEDGADRAVQDDTGASDGGPPEAAADIPDADAGGRPDVAADAPSPVEEDAATDGDRGAERASLTEIPGVPLMPASILTLRDAVRLALANNRDYQSNREGVFLTALDLTRERYRFAPRFFGVVMGDWAGDSSGEESGSISTDFGFNWLLATGARVSVAALNNFSRFFTGDSREVARTAFEASISQPLLRGFGRDIVQEPLVQAERSVVYEIRSFERFRQTFGARVVSEYYRVLQAHDRIINEYNNWRNLVIGRDRVESFAEAGRLAPMEVDQARQDELQAQDRYLAAVQAYETQLDDFKITLGIPVEEVIALDPRELTKLVEAGTQPLELDLPRVRRFALERRLDLLTARDEVEDAMRRIEVLADALRAQLDVDAGVSIPSDDSKPLDFDVDNISYGAGFTLDLPFDRKDERNAFVSALVSLERSRRSLSLFEDTIRLSVRDTFRTLQREITSYQIQKASVALAEQRVESTFFLLEAGRAQTRDLLESQSSLVQAQNALTGSLVNYTIARLQFFRDIGALRVDDDGAVVETDIVTGVQ